MVYLFKILDLSKTAGIKVMPYIPPANYEYAEKIVGASFLRQYEDNLQKMKSWIKEKGPDVLDMSYLLSSDRFADVTTIDESANYQGRVKIMEAIKENCPRFGVTL